MIEIRIRKKAGYAMVRGVNSHKAAMYASGNLPPNYPVPALVIDHDMNFEPWVLWNDRWFPIYSD